KFYSNKTRGDAALSLPSVAHPRLTSDNRKMPQLGIFPNSLSLRFREPRLSLMLCKIARNFFIYF
ncbi:hypothetical protein KJ809_00520, partial [Patescibacteria group bacterium]|nr:hypothetical protein [Patescibacteria group bacterium]